MNLWEQVRHYIPSGIEGTREQDIQFWSEWYYSRGDKTGSTVKTYSSGESAQGYFESQAPPKVGVTVGVYDPEANALLSPEV